MATSNSVRSLTATERAPKSMVARATTNAESALCAPAAAERPVFPDLIAHVHHDADPDYNEGDPDCQGSPNQEDDEARKEKGVADSACSPTTSAHTWITIGGKSDRQTPKESVAERSHEPHRSSGVCILLHTKRPSAIPAVDREGKVIGSARSARNAGKGRCLRPDRPLPSFGSPSRIAPSHGGARRSDSMSPCRAAAPSWCLERSCSAVQSWR